MKYREEDVKRLVLAGKALTEAPPGKFDPKEAGGLAVKLDDLLRDIQYVEATSDSMFFGWLDANIPETSDNMGRPAWIESQKVMAQDQALLHNFDEMLERNIAANGGKKHGASKKAYADLTDKYGAGDEYTVKRRVLRARGRRKALKETMQDILRMAARAQGDGDNATAREEYKTRRDKLLEALRRILEVR